MQTVEQSEKKKEKKMTKKSMLLICPTRERPEMFKRMVESLKKTSVADVRVTLCAFIDIDEPFINEYKKIFPLGETNLPVTQSINTFFSTSKKYDYYSVTNDDFVYNTVGWNAMLAESAGQWGIAYGDDLSGTDIPTTSVIGGHLARAVGWLQLPELKYLYGDMVWRQIGLELKCLKYCPQVVTEHRHFLNGKADKRHYSRTNAKDVYDHDQIAFRHWRDHECKNLIERIKKCQKSA